MSEEKTSLMKQFEEETEKRALYRGKPTKAFQKWRESRKMAVEEGGKPGRLSLLINLYQVGNVCLKSLK